MDDVCTMNLLCYIYLIRVLNYVVLVAVIYCLCAVIYCLCAELCYFYMLFKVDAVQSGEKSFTESNFETGYQTTSQLSLSRLIQATKHHLSSARPNSPRLPYTLQNLS